ncbi:MAG: VOC family protein [Pseudomonadota bacterium]
MITGINHITLAVSDLAASIQFYRDTLGCELVSVHASGACFSAGGLWLCLSVDEHVAGQSRMDYTHVAFDIASDDFAAFSERLVNAGVSLWKRNCSEGQSLYFLDPDGHKLELHVGSLATRLAAMQQRAGTERTGVGCGC